MTADQRARLVLATANRKKLAELNRILAGGHVDVDLATVGCAELSRLQTEALDGALGG